MSDRYGETVFQKAHRVREIWAEDGLQTLTNEIATVAIRKAYQYRYAATGTPILTMGTPAGPIEFEADVGWKRLADIARGDVYEPLLLKTMYPMLDAGDVVYNVGARWGIISEFVAAAGVSAEQIHNFEADSDAVDILRRNVGDSMPITEGFVGDGHAETIAIDEYATEHEPPSVLKIDVEGAEAPVLRGAKSTLVKHRPTVFVELHPEHMHTVPDGQQATIDILESAGYDLRASIDHRRGDRWEAVDAVEFSEDRDHMILAAPLPQKPEDETVTEVRT